MAGSLNRATLIGRLGRDPESRSLQSGGKVVNFSIATSERWKDKTTGEQREQTEWHRVVIFNEGLAGVAERFLKKGSNVMVEGQLQTRAYTDKDGQQRQTTEVVLRGMGAVLVLLDPAPGGGAREGAGGGSDSGTGGGWSSGSSSGQQPEGGQSGASGGGWGFGGGSRPGTLDDKIPFHSI